MKLGVTVSDGPRYAGGTRPWFMTWSGITLALERHSLENSLQLFLSDITSFVHYNSKCLKKKAYHCLSVKCYVHITCTIFFLITHCYHFRRTRRGWWVQSPGATPKNLLMMIIVSFLKLVIKIKDTKKSKWCI